MTFTRYLRLLSSYSKYRIETFPRAFIQCFLTAFDPCSFTRAGQHQTLRRSNFFGTRLYNKIFCNQLTLLLVITENR